MHLINAIAQTLYEQATERDSSRLPWSSVEDRQRDVWIRDALAVFETAQTMGYTVVRSYDVDSLNYYVNNPSAWQSFQQDLSDKIENLKSMQPRITR